MYFYLGKPPQVVKEEYSDYGSAYVAYNRRGGCSKILACGYEVKSSQAQSKKNKSGLKKIKDYINTEK